MSDTGLALDTTQTPPPPRTGGRPRWYWFAIVGGALLVVSTVRVLTGADDIDSSGAVTAAIGLAMPIGLAGLGGLWSERSGVVNIGLEGMMILGTWGGAFFGYHYGPWAGILGAILLGVVGGAIHALATVIFGVDHIVSGVAINLLGAGAGAYLAVRTFTGLPGGGPTQSPPLEQLPFLSIPGLSDLLGSIEQSHIWLVSDVASVLRAVTTNVNVLTIIAVLLLIASWWVLWRTAFGLRLRSCGEAPEAAETLGVNVIRYKFVAVLISGGLAGLAGGFLVLVASNLYREGQTGGRGYIGLAAMIFGNWRPGGLAAGAGLFGYADAVQLRGGGDVVRAYLLPFAIALLAWGVWALVRRHRGKPVRGVVGVVMGIAALAWFLASPRVPNEFTGMTPYIATLLVLAFASQRLRPPAADGQIYRKGEGDLMPDWAALQEAAVAAMHHAYAPYSHFPVGVAGLVDDGRVVVGCNVENASYGVALCAECGLVSQLHASGGGRLVAVVCVGEDGALLMPCGRCRQLLWENGGPSCAVLTPLGERSMQEMLPQAFGAADLSAHHPTPS